VPGAGAVLDGASAALALRLPGPRADWTLRLGTEGGGPLGLWINGMRHDPLPGGGGPQTVRIAEDILEFDARSRTWRAGITLVPEGERPLVAELAAQRALPAFAGAPVLPLGRPVRPEDPVGRRCLGEGWHWPGPSGARMAAPRAKLRLSVAGRHDHVLHLVADPLPLMVGLADAAPEQEIDAPGTGLCVTLPAAAVPPTGLVELTLVAAEDAPRPQLESLSLLPVDATDPLPPGRFAAPADLGAVESAAGGVRLVLPCPVAEPLLLRFESAAAGPGPGQDGSGAGASADPAIGEAAMSAAEGAETDGAEAEGAQARIVAGDDRLSLRLAGAARATFAPRRPVGRIDIALPAGLRLTGIARPPARAAAPRPRQGDSLDADALAGCAEAPELWHGADGEGLWLGANAGRLHLPRPGPGPLRLVAQVLTLPGTGQRLELRAGGAAARSGAPEGPQTLVLEPCEGSGGGLTLEVATNLLIDARLVGLESGELLGGAILGAALAPAEPRHASAS